MEGHKIKAMKQVNYFILFLFLSIATSLVSCGDDDNNEKPQAGITDPSWSNGETLEIDKGKSLSVSFNAAAKWVAQVTVGTDWCKLNKTSGAKGQHTLELSVSTTTTADRTAKVSIYVDGYAPAGFEVTQRASEPAETEDMEVNRQVDEYLKEMYLWNDEYKTLPLDFTQNYEDFFYGALGSMKTNTLDKRPAGNGQYSLFSYIEKKNPIGTTRSGTQIEREQEYSFGFTGMIAVKISNDKKYAFCIQGVYPDSPASTAGIRRGTYISKVNGQAITESNMQSLFLDLMLPESTPTLSLTEFIIHEDNTTETKEMPAVTAKAMYKNPILHKDVIETGGHKIGYLVYSEFDAGFDDLLFDAFKEFKSQGIEDLVLDLRYNGGGHVTSANLIASCVAGSKSKGKVFAKYRYNADRMKDKKDKNLEEPFLYDNYANLNSSLSAGGLDLGRLYCLVGNQTASASELVINSLRGIDTEVVLIGAQTTGKNVGMEPVEVTARENTYRVVPITFQTYNAKGFGDYQDGFTPNIPLDETDADGDGYFDDYMDYGKPEEPLLARAIQEITGQTLPQVRSLNRKTTGRKILQMPVIYRPGHDGMIKINEPIR